MTETEKKALALVNEVEGGNWLPHETDRIRNFATICRAIEQHEAFRQEVSDVCEGLLACTNANKRYGASLVLNRFIIAKGDPLVEALDDLKDGRAGPTTESYAACLRAAIEARGGRIVWEGE